MEIMKKNIKHTKKTAKNYVKKSMRKYINLIIISLFVFTPSVGSASVHGYYFGGQFGVGNTNLNSIPSSEVESNIHTVINDLPKTFTVSNGSTTSQVTITALSVNSINLGSFNHRINDKVYVGKLYLGYQLTDFLAIELGTYVLKNTNSKYTSNTIVNANATVKSTTNGVTTPGTGTITTSNVSSENSISDYGFDLLLKTIWPVKYNFDIYAKAGLTYLFESIKTTIDANVPSATVFTPNAATLPPFMLSSSVTTNHNTYYPMIELGASYAVTEHTKIAFEWSRIIRKNSFGKNIDMFTGGFMFDYS